MFEHIVFLEPERNLADAISGHYTVSLVLLSAFIAIISSYTAFLIHDRIKFATHTNKQIAWLITGSVALGTGIWAMHFIGMLAYVTPLETHYDSYITMLSVFPAIAASVAVIRPPKHNKAFSYYSLIWRSTLMGGGIGLMHYTGMHAMHINGIMRYEPSLFCFSIIAAIALSAASLKLKQWATLTQSEQLSFTPKLLLAATIMGLAITTMHYTGMHAMHIFQEGAHHTATNALSSESLAKIIAVAVILICASLIASITIIQRLQFYDRIKASETRQRIIVETAADGIITINNKGIIETFNLAAEKIFGYNAKEVIGKNVSVLLPDKEQAQHEKFTLNSELHEMRVINKSRDLYGRRKDGSLIPMELNISPMTIMGEPGFVGVLRDITTRINQQKITERRHQAQKVIGKILSTSLDMSLNEFLQKSIDIIIDTSVISTKPAGAIFLANDKDQKLVMAAQKGLNPALLTQCANLAYGKCHCGKAAATKQIQFSKALDHHHEITFEGIQPHGHYCVPILYQGELLGVLNIYLEEHHQPSEDEDEFLTMIANTLAGVIHRRRNEEELARFKTTLDHTLDCVFMFDAQTLNFFYVNAGAMKQVGYTQAELMLMTPYDIKPNFDETSFRQLITPMIEGKQPVLSLETLHQHKDGHTIPVEIFLQYVNPVGEPPRFVSIVHDISERQRIDKLKNEFVSTVSHEIRTPLTSIRGALGLVNSGIAGELSPQAQAMLTIANNNTERLLLLINDILDIQKIESGHMSFHLQKIELMPFIHKSLQDNTAYAQQHQVTLQLSNELDNVYLLGDPDRLAQVMSNILSNAAKFSPKNSCIDINLSQQQDMVRIAVHDQGPGIPKEFQPKLFEKFSQADSTDTRKVGGTGLGLSITKMLIEKHGGNLSFTSEAGQGTTFFIDLPKATDNSSSAC